MRSAFHGSWSGQLAAGGESAPRGLRAASDHERSNRGAGGGNLCESACVTCDVTRLFNLLMVSHSLSPSARRSVFVLFVFFTHCSHATFHFGRVHDFKVAIDRLREGVVAKKSS